VSGEPACADRAGASDAESTGCALASVAAFFLRTIGGTGAVVPFPCDLRETEDEKGCSMQMIGVHRATHNNHHNTPDTKIGTVCMCLLLCMGGWLSLLL